ncbi:ABC transporter ATP-binding protein [Paenibacillus urinalis]|uniref:ABC transporter ATP-binding protein n=1 Tax=Paenibacillus urinalis TaxID=521520 RepID=A0ABY7X467_9BACL|nr:ABC transporter ATP-binding protein [Paenibacillus urinalis]WDH96592.1 ABC transporter ATP-binding protein [Paenibacillus urinalis]WDI00238.1 ABC transporter ATP-binding protein [Paenibacillus urinalis]
MTQTLLQVRDLSKRFKEREVVKGISFSINEGSCAAILGPNGAGKTTTINMLAGLLQPSGGSIELLVNGSPTMDRRPYIGFLPQMPVFYPWMTGAEFLLYAGELAGLTSHEAKKETGEWLEAVGIRDAGKRKIGGYSGGMKQRLGLAQALIHRPKLLILDEPVSALDPTGRKDVLTLLQRIRKETTVLFSTHVLHDVEEVCDEILMIRSGDIALQGSLDHVRQTYSEPVISLEVGGDEASRSWLTAVCSKDFVIHSEISGGRAKMRVANVEQASLALMTDAVSHCIMIRSLEAGHSTLEDLFMKVVQS